jgi:hypothetical protein
MIAQQDGLGTEIYANGQTRSAWLGWQASRQALVVELPDWDGHDRTQQYIEAVIDELDRAGVAYK